MIIRREVIYKLLWSTIEEFVGLWELEWEVDSLLHNSVIPHNNLAQKILLYFLDSGLIKLYYDKWGDDQLQEISQEEAIEIIKGEKFWSPPEVNEICVKVGSTEKGERYYNEELIQDIEFQL